MATKKEMFEKTLEELMKDIKLVLLEDKKTLGLVRCISIHRVGYVEKGKVMKREGDDYNVDGLTSWIEEQLNELFGDAPEDLSAVVRILDPELLPMRSYAIRHEGYDHDYGKVICNYLNFTPRVTVTVGYRPQEKPKEQPKQDPRPHLKSVKPADQRPSDEGNKDGK